MEAKLNPLFKAAVAEKRVPAIGACVVNQEGKFIFHKTFGSNNIDEQTAAFQGDTVVAIYSVTKLFTTIAALQLIERGQLAIDDLAEKYVPRIANIQVLEVMHVGPDGKQPVTRPAKTKPTIRDLLTHTAGFTYDAFDVPTKQWKEVTGRPQGSYYTLGEWADFETPYRADPGSSFCYGINTDWLGFAIEAVSGLALPEYLKKYILEPLGLQHTGPYSPSYSSSLVPVHMKVNGTLKAVPEVHLNPYPPNWGGGGFLYSTMNDLAKLLSTVLNAGTSPSTHQQILHPATIQRYLFTDWLAPDLDKTWLGEIRSTSTAMSNEVSLLPTSQRGWSCGLLLNADDLPFGRSANSGMWCGMGNTYYWIDPKAKIAGLVVTHLFPFLDGSVLKLFDQLERVAYRHELGEEDDGQANYAQKRP